MASCDMSGDGVATSDFYDLLNDEEDEEVVETELEEPNWIHDEYIIKSECLDYEEDFDEEEDLDEEEYLARAECLHHCTIEGGEASEAKAGEASEAKAGEASESKAEEASQAMAFETEAASETDKAELHSESDPSAVGTVLAMWNEDLYPLPLTSRSPPMLHTSAADPGSPSILTPFDVIVTASLDDDIAMEEDHVFHLADEHQLFQQVEEMVEKAAAEQPQQQRRQRRGRGRGRRSRGKVSIGDPEWVRGERLVEVNINDDDVSEDLREQIMRIVKTRNAARVQQKNRAKRQRDENEEEWMDADADEVESYFAADGTSDIFEWSPMGDYQGEREKFLPQQTGAVVASKNAYEAFRQYWDDGIMSHIVTETNRYAAGLAGSSASFARDWYDTNIHELFILFSFWMMLGIIRLPSIKTCFTVNPLLQTNIFSKLFSRRRYEHLCRAFHLNDNSSKPTDSPDPLFSLGPIVDHLNARFQETYIPSQNICIDESLTLWKGNLSFRQYIKTKTAQFGVKTFELCESSTGYLWSFFVYTGAGDSHDSGFPSNLPKSTPIVIRLVRPLLDKGYTLFMDNWFNSPVLARFLKTRKTDCVGTLRATRRNVPPLIPLCTLKDGQFVARHSGDVVVVAFQDKKRKIATISTYHGTSQGQVEPKPQCPAKYKLQMVLDYNKSMGGVDRKDQMLEPYLLERKRCAKWNVKFFKRLLNCSILNARILLQSSAANRKEHLVFRLELVDQILQHHHHKVPKITPTQPVSSSLGRPLPRVQHFPEQTDLLASDGRHRRRRCLWCSQHQKYKRTTYTCSVCEVPLCVDPCFALYHKK